MSNLGEIIRYFRESRHMTLRAFAKAIEISPAYLSQVETDQRIPSDALLEKMIHTLVMSEGEQARVYSAFASAKNDIPTDVKEFLIHNGLIETIREISFMDTDGSLLRRLAENMHIINENSENQNMSSNKPLETYDTKSAGEIIKGKREQLSLTANTCAGKLEISATYLLDIEHNNRHFPLKLSRQFIATLQMTREESQELYDVVAYANKDLPLDVKEYLLDNGLVDVVRLLKQNDSTGEVIKHFVSSVSKKR